MSTEQQTAPHGITDPLTGNVVAVGDIDGLADLFEKLVAVEDRIFLAKRDIKSALLAWTSLEGIDTKTRRIRGTRRRIKLEMPGPGWEQSILKEAWNAYPVLRDELLRVEKIAVKLREFGKVSNEAGPADFQQFVAMVKSAERSPSGMPSVSVEA